MAPPFTLHAKRTACLLPSKLPERVAITHVGDLRIR